MRICMRISMRHSIGHSIGHSIPHGIRNGVRSLRIVCEWHANGMRKGICDIRPPQQPLKHQTKAHYGMRNYGIRQGIRQGMRHGMRNSIVFIYVYSPDMPG